MVARMLPTMAMGMYYLQEQRAFEAIQRLEEQTPEEEKRNLAFREEQERQDQEMYRLFNKIKKAVLDD